MSVVTKACPLVPVDEGMGLGNAEGVGGAEDMQIGLAIGGAVRGPRAGGFQKSDIPQARGAAVAGDLAVMEGQNGAERNPDWRAHASA